LNAYYCVIEQGEYATDLLFRQRTSLEATFCALIERAMTEFSADAALRYSGANCMATLKGK
jgi:hypothetical protein